MKQVFSSKVVMEHDLGITSEQELKSIDDCILSSLVFVHKCLGEVRVVLEMHYFYFVGETGVGIGTGSITATSQMQLTEIDEMEDEVGTVKENTTDKINRKMAFEAEANVEHLEVKVRVS